MTNLEPPYDRVRKLPKQFKPLTTMKASVSAD